MRRLSLLKNTWFLALLALVIAVGSISFYNWHKNESLGIDGRKDNCAAAVEASQSAGAYGIPVMDDSAQAMQELLAAQPLDVRGVDNATPSMPVLVHPIRMHTGYDVNDCPHWLLPVHDAEGHVVAIADYVYEYPHKLIRFSNAGRIFPGEPRYRNPFPYLSAEQAIALLQRQRGVVTLRNPVPELVFLPIDIGFPEQHGPGWGWPGGGVMPSDPVWLLAGADGRDYLIGTDHHVYTLHDVPLS